jgi:hypothetical protein
MEKELKIVAPDGYEIDRENSTLERIVFKKKPIALPKSWEEFCSRYPRQIGESFITIDSRVSSNVNSGMRLSSNDRNVLPNYDAARQHLVLMQLHQLRDCYRQGWKPDWSSTCVDGKVKYCIIIYGGNVSPVTSLRTQHFLSFKDESTRDLFLENFKDLIEQAGDLI